MLTSAHTIKQNRSMIWLFWSTYHVWISRITSQVSSRPHSCFPSLSWVRYHPQLSFNFIILARLGCFYVTALLSWGCGWVKVEIEAQAEVDLRLRLKWGILVEVNLKLSLGWVELSLNQERKWAFIRSGSWFSNSRTTFVFYASFNSYF